MSSWNRRLPAPLAMLCMLSPAWGPSSVAVAQSGVQAPAARAAAVGGASAGEALRTVKVVVFPEAPFASSSPAGEWSGYGVALLEAAAVDAKLALDFRAVSSQDEVFDELASGRADVGVGNILVTAERLGAVDFTQPILDGGLRIMVPSDRSHTLARLWQGMIDDGHVRVLFWGSMITLVASIVLLFILRRIDREFSRDWHEGFSESLYHVVSVLMTGKTNYSGKLLPAWIARILAAIWLVFGVASVAYLTSSLTSVMTSSTLTSRVAGPADLKGKTVATLRDSAGDRYCAESGLDVRRFASVEDAAAALAAKTVDAVVADAQTLAYYDTAHPEVPVTTVGEVFENRHYAFAVRPHDEDLRTRLDRAIVGLRERGELARIGAPWFGR